MAKFTDTIQLNTGGYLMQNIRIDPAGNYAGVSLLNKSTKMADSITENLNEIYNFTQFGSWINPQTISIFGNSKGKLSLINQSGSVICQCNAGLTATYARGLVQDPYGTLIYTSDRYVGKGFSTTVATKMSDVADTLVLADATNFPASGQALIVNGTTTGDSEIIRWTGKTSNTLTGVTRGYYYTYAKLHPVSSKVYYFDDDWKDLGAELNSTREMLVWEDSVFIANGNKVAGYRESDGSDWNTALLTLPTGWNIIDFGVLPTSAGTLILIGANKGENGKIFVWDGRDTKWKREISAPNITCIEEELIGTEQGLFSCDGYKITQEWKVKGAENVLVGRTAVIKDIKKIGTSILLTISGDVTPLNRSGLYILDAKGNTLVIDGSQSIQAMYGIFVSSERVLIVSTGYLGGSIQTLQYLPLENGSQLWFEYSPKNAKSIRLKTAKLNLSIDTYDEYNNKNISFDCVLRVYDYTEPLIQRTQLRSGTSQTAGNVVTIVAGLGDPAVGDMLEIYNKHYPLQSNICCKQRQIVSIDGASLTLDGNLATNITANDYNTSQDVYTYKLKKAHKYSVESEKMNYKEMDFIFENMPVGKKFLFEIEFINNGTIAVSPQISSMEIEGETI